jgi:hypothetical protein
MFVVFFIFFFAIQSKIVDVTQSQDVLTLKEANNLVKAYFDLARQSYVDFHHSFVLPDLGNFEYSVKLESNDTLVSKIDDKEYVDFLPYIVKGYILTGSSNTNVVYHQDGNISTSSGVYVYDSKAQGIFVNVNAEKCLFLQKNFICNDSSTPSKTDCQKYVGLC